MSSAEDTARTMTTLPQRQRPVSLPALHSAPVLDVVIPVLDEEAALDRCVRVVHDHLTDTFPYLFHITIADNGSTDRTPEIAADLAAELPEVDWVRLPTSGRGQALSAVWNSSDAPVLAYLDVDLSTDLSALFPLVAPLISGHSDLAIGTRLAPGARVVRGPKREFISRCYNLLLRGTLSVRFSDAQCGFKAIRKDAAERLLPDVRDGDWFFDTELLVLAERAGLRIHEVPVDWVDDPDSRVRLLPTALADLRGILRIGPRRHVGPHGQVLGLYLLLKLTGLLSFLYLLDSAGEFRAKPTRYGGGARVWDVLGSWDGWWYRQIAEHGYDPRLVPVGGPESQAVLENSAAFFPLYPYLIRMVSAVTGLGSFGSGILVSVLASCVAALGIYTITTRLSDHRTGLIAVGLWAVWPGSGVEWAVYSESVFVALAVWACHAMITSRWLTAGWLVFLAGLSRPTAAALVAALVVTVVLTPHRRKDGIPRLIAVLLAPAGLIGYVVWVGLRAGEPDAYFVLQSQAWGHYFDYGVHTLDVTKGVLVGHTDYLFAMPFEDQIAVTVMVLSLILLVALIALRPPSALVVYTVATMIMVLGSQQIFGNVSRYLLPLFPLFLPMALVLRNLRPVALSTTFVVAALASGSYAGYALFLLGVP